MAKKYLTSFEPGDVLMVVLRCVKCKAELSLPIAKNGLQLIPDDCPACREEWNVLEQRRNHKRQTESLLGALRYFSAKPEPDSKPSDRMPWTVRLVIESGPGSTGEDVQEVS